MRKYKRGDKITSVTDYESKARFLDFFLWSGTRPHIKAGLNHGSTGT